MGAKLFQDDSGNTSVMRVMTLLFVCWCIASMTYILIIWGYVALTTNTFPSLTMGDVSTVFGGVGAIGFKALQKRFEHMGNPTEGDR